MRKFTRMNDGRMWWVQYRTKNKNTKGKHKKC